MNETINNKYIKLVLQKVKFKDYNLFLELCKTKCETELKVISMQKLNDDKQKVKFINLRKSKVDKCKPSQMQIPINLVKRTS